MFPAKCQVFHLDILQNFHFYGRTNPIPPRFETSHRPYLYTSPSSVMPYDSVNEHRNFVNFTSPSDDISTFCGSLCMRSDSSVLPCCCSVRAVSVSSNPSWYSAPASSRNVIWNWPLANNAMGRGSGTSRG